MIIDTHCHLDAFSNQALSIQLNPAHRYLTMGTSSQNWQSVCQLSHCYSNVHFALGLHPWFIDDQYQQQLTLLRELLHHNGPVAIGEIGLDFSPQHRVTRDAQSSAFEAQLDLAQQMGLPVSLHVVKAHNEVLKLLSRYPVVGTVHSFAGSIEEAQRYVDRGFKLGVNAIVVRDNARRYHQFVRYFGLQHLVLETDAPNLLLPGRSEARLEDIFVVASQVAALLGLTPAEVIEQTCANARHVFNI